MPTLNGSTLLERARRHADDTVEPYFITDTEMYQYLSEAERALAVAGKLLRQVRDYTIAEDDRWISMGVVPEVLEFRDAVLTDSNDNRYPLKLIGTLDTSENNAGGTNYDYGSSALTRKLTPGRPKALVLGKRSNYFELSPPADASYTIEASLIIYPSFGIEQAADEPTIPERHHKAIAIGAALYALEGSEHEHLKHKMSSLGAAWQRALSRAAEESGIINRDAGGPVQFSNILW